MSLLSPVSPVPQVQCQIPSCSVPEGPPSPVQAPQPFLLLCLRIAGWECGGQSCLFLPHGHKTGTQLPVLRGQRLCRMSGEHPALGKICVSELEGLGKWVDLCGNPEVAVTAFSLSNLFCTLTIVWASSPRSPSSGLKSKEFAQPAGENVASSR